MEFMFVPGNSIFLVIRRVKVLVEGVCKVTAYEILLHNKIPW